MIYFQVQDIKGKILAGNMEQYLSRNDVVNNKNFSKHKNGKGIRSACEIVDDLNVWVLVEDEADLLKSSKLFSKTFNLYKIVAFDIYNQYKKEIGEYAHILDTIQGQIRQKIDDFADNKQFYGETYTDSIKNILEIIKGNEESVSDLICYIQKRIIDMRAHLLGTEVIHSGEQYEIKSFEVSLKKAILNQCTPFLEEFEKNKIKIKFFFEDDCKIDVDKNMFSLIMYNFFSNALKYCKTDSDIRLNYSLDQKSLDISMISLKMEKDELSILSNERVRGKHAKNIPGKGIGLFVIQKSLSLMKKDKMYISPNYEKVFNYNDNIYIENHFKFVL